MADVPASPRREAILAAATRLFAQQGFHGVGMRAIADAVGIRSSSLYHHFPSKVALLRVISRDYTRRFIEEHEYLFDSDGAPADRMRHLIRDQVIYFHEHRLEARVGLAHLRELSELEPESYAEVQEVRRRYQHGIERLIAEGVRTGDFEVSDPWMAGQQVMGLVASIRDWFNEGGELTIEQVADAYVDAAVVRLLGARPDDSDAA